jgi:hypothetical protein
MHSFGVTLDRDLGRLAATLGLSWQHEEESILGGQFHSAISQNGADTLFADVGARWAPVRGWSIGLESRLGLTRARRSATISGGSQLLSNGWAFDVTRADVLAQGDSLGVRISQPLRVEAGGLRLNLPSSFDYTTETAGYSIQRFSLAPEGRELVGELAWQSPLPFGHAGASVFYRHEPGHYANSPRDVGAMISFSADF